MTLKIGSLWTVTIVTSPGLHVDQWLAITQQFLIQIHLKLVELKTA